MDQNNRYARRYPTKPASWLVVAVAGEEYGNYLAHLANLFGSLNQTVTESQTTMTEKNENDPQYQKDSAEFFRREFLGSSAALGLGAQSGGRYSPLRRPNTGAETDNVQPSATAQADDLTQAETLTVGNLHIKSHPVVDVRAWGATGDGETDDAAAIQAAVENIDDHGVLYFGPGTYRLGHTVTVDVDSVHRVVGENAYIVLDGDRVAFEIVGDSTDGSAPPNARGQNLYRTQVQPVVTGLQFYSDRGIREPYVGTALQIKNVFGLQVIACGFHNLDTGIEFVDTSRNVLVRNNHFHDNQHYGIHWNGCNLHQTVVADNFMGYSKILLFADAAELYNVHIANNDLEVGIAEKDGVRNILLADVTEGGTVASWKVQGNTIEDHHGATDALVRFRNGRKPRSGGELAAVRFVEVVDNTIGNSGAIGVALENVSGFRIDDNAFYRSTDAAIVARQHLEDVSISDNRITGYYLDTVYGKGVEITSTQIRGLTVADNVFGQLSGRPLSIRNPVGPLPSWVSDLAWENVQITDNLVRLKTPHELHLDWLDDYRLSGYAIDVVNRAGSVSGLRVSGNQLRMREYAEHGLRISAAFTEGAVVSENVITGDVPGDTYNLPDGPGVAIATNVPSRHESS